MHSRIMIPACTLACSWHRHCSADNCLHPCLLQVAIPQQAAAAGATRSFGKSGQLMRASSLFQIPRTAEPARLSIELQTA